MSYNKFYEAYEWVAREVFYLDLTRFLGFSEFILFNIYSIYEIKIIICLNVKTENNRLLILIELHLKW